MTLDRLQQILIIALLSLGIAFILLQFYIFFDKRKKERDLVMKNLLNDVSALKNNTNISDTTTQRTATVSTPIITKGQTDFFNKSVQYAEDVLFSKSFLPQYGDASFYGNRILDAVYKSDDNTKSLILSAIQDMSSDARVARINETQLRSISEQQKIPLWFSILREATNKVIPDTKQQIVVVNPTTNPLFKVA